MYWLEENFVWIVVVVVLAFGGVLFIVTSDNSDKFKKACTLTNGHPVFDGRQWQCLKHRENT